MAKYLTFYLMPLTSNRFNLRKTLQNSDCLSDATVPQGKVLASLIWYLLSFIQVCLEDTFDHMLQDLYQKHAPQTWIEPVHLAYFWFHIPI